MDINTLIYRLGEMLPGFVFAVVIHEYAHGWMAKRYGDDTAERMGRLTLNPTVHIDPIGTVLFPLIGLVSGFFVFGYAKPVPVDSRNFKDFKKATFWVSFAGPLANFLTGTLSIAVLTYIQSTSSDLMGYRKIVIDMLNYSFLINFVLGGFNMIPVPPLDGSKVLAMVLPPNSARKYEEISRYTPRLFFAAIILSFAGLPIFNWLLAPAFLLAGLVRSLFQYIFF